MDTFQISLFFQLDLLSAARYGMTDKDFIPLVILAPQPPFRFCFIDLITDNSGTDLLRFRGETIRDVCIVLELSDCSGVIVDVILYHHRARVRNIYPFPLDRAMRRLRGKVEWLFGSFVHSGTQVRRQAQEFWFHKPPIHAMKWLRGEAMTPLFRNLLKLCQQVERPSSQNSLHYSNQQKANDVSSLYTYQFFQCVE